MQTWIAFLRGVNVGGHNKIKMEDLRKALAFKGFKNVKTYIQSGNIIFESDNAGSTIKAEIHDCIMSDFFIDCEVIIRTKEELKAIIGALPFSAKQIEEADNASDNVSLYVTIFDRPVGADVVKTLESMQNERELFEVIDKEIYMLFYDSILDSKVNKHAMPKRGATARNWRTLNKVLDIAETLN